MIVLVTGSRLATSRHASFIANALRDAVGGDVVGHTLWHGDGRGVDHIAALTATHWGWTVNAIPADWSAPCRGACQPGHRRRRGDGTDFCPAAGVYRNQTLVDAVAALPDAVCVGIPIPGASRGTHDCMRRARAAGISVIEHSLINTSTTGATP